jgi:leucyl/phenylalanyl-tRNA---protein transferase
MLGRMARMPDESELLLVPAGVNSAALPAEIGLTPPRFFPPPTATTSEGLLCMGGRLSPEWLLDAYQHGIFPWPMWDDEPIAWWSPDPRAIIEFDGLHVSRRLQRTLANAKFDITSDRDFAGVIHGCGSAGGRALDTWLTASMIDAYCELHRMEQAHSVEVWHQGRLAGGVYGVALGGFFAAESMFHTVRDASKVALVHLITHLRGRGFTLIDVQQWTPHTSRFGAIEIPRLEFLRRLATAINLPVYFGKLSPDSIIEHLE